jgi:hypothetical protein
MSIFTDNPAVASLYAWELLVEHTGEQLVVLTSATICWSQWPFQGRELEGCNKLLATELLSLLPYIVCTFLAGEDQISGCSNWLLGWVHFIALGVSKLLIGVSDQLDHFLTCRGFVSS